MGQFSLFLLGSILVALMGVLVNYLTHDYADPTGKKRRWVIAGILITVLLTAVVAWVQQPEATSTQAAASTTVGETARNAVAATSSPTAVGVPAPGTQRDDQIAPGPGYRPAGAARTDSPALQSGAYSIPYQTAPTRPHGALDQPASLQSTIPAQRPSTGTSTQTARPGTGNPPTGQTNPGTVSLTISAPAQGCESHSIDVDTSGTALTAEVKDALRPKFKVEAELCNSMKSIVIRLRSRPANGGRKLEPDRPLNLAQAQTERTQARADAEFDQALRRNTADEANQYRLLFIEAALLQEFGYFRARDLVVSLLHDSK